MRVLGAMSDGSKLRVRINLVGRISSAGTRWNSLGLEVASVRPPVKAVAAIQRSCAPMTSPEA